MLKKRKSTKNGKGPGEKAVLQRIHRKLEPCEEDDTVLVRKMKE